jgi:hypothetical protein
VSVKHVYKQAGIHTVNVRVTDVNQVSAFLQVIAVSNGIVGDAGGELAETEATERTVVLWIPAAVALGLLFPTFWLGRRSQLVSLRNKMLKERDTYQSN